MCVCVCVCVLQAFRSYIFKSFFRSYLFKSVFEEEQEESDLAISKTDLELLMIFMKQNSCNEGFLVFFCSSYLFSSHLVDAVLDLEI